MSTENSIYEKALLSATTNSDEERAVLQKYANLYHERKHKHRDYNDFKTNPSSFKHTMTDKERKWVSAAMMAYAKECYDPDTDIGDHEWGFLKLALEANEVLPGTYE